MLSRALIPIFLALMLSACGGGGGGGSSGGGQTPPQNRAPTVTSVSFQVAAGADLSSTLTASDPENGAVTFTKTSDPTHGQLVSFAANGAFSYRPNAAFVGADTFNISASDGTNQVVATITINVIGGANPNPNVPPTVTSASFQVAAGAELSATLTASDPESDVVTFTKTSDPVHGQLVSFAASGAFSYRPNAAFVGADTFNVSASDGTNQVAATITINVTSGANPNPNVAPTVTSASFRVDAGTDLSATLTASDPENNPVTFAKTSEPAHGQLVSFAANGAFVYRPDAGFVGADTFTVSASDGTNQVAATITINVVPNAQLLLFAQAGPLKVFVGDTVSNVATGPGTGVVTYVSSDPSIATVDASGLVTVLAAGSIEIRANKAADAAHTAAQGSYRLDSSETGVSFTSWVGSQGSEVTFPDTAAGLEFYRSSAPDCDLANYTSCADGQMDILASSSVTDSALTLTRPAYYTLAHGDTKASLTVSAATFPGRASHQVVEFKNQFWVIGGESNREDEFLNDVWSSSDGVHWIQRTAHAEFSARASHQVVVFDGQLWLIGGVDERSLKNDVWSSSDGITWTERTAEAEFSPRIDFRSVVYDDQIWLTGGADGDVQADVWSSRNGISWTRQNAAAEFGPRFGHAMVVHDDKMWVIAGNSQFDRKSDVWSSSDGVRWTQQTAEAEFDSRTNHQVVEHQNQMWLIGGGGADRFRDVWSSGDGIRWTQRRDADFSARSGHEAVVHDNQLWVIGGRSSNASNNDVWSTSDGENWTQRKPGAGATFPQRLAHTVTFFHDELWMVGGIADEDFTDIRNDVWSSRDGLTWRLRTDDPGFPTRALHQVVSFRDRLWVIGGLKAFEANSDLNDIWSSEDGVSWTLETSAAEFPARAGHQVVVFDNQLWLIGGEANLGRDLMNDVWSSSDGVHWTQRAAAAEFPARLDHQVVAFNDQLWLIAGNAAGKTNDVWSSSDGVHWTQRTAEAEFTAREGHQVLAFGGRLWLIGGADADPINDVWSSTDGIHWTLQTAQAPFPGRMFHAAVVLDEHMLILGGSAGTPQGDVWRSTDGIDWSMGFIDTFQFR